MFAGKARAEGTPSLTEKARPAIAACRSRPSLQAPAIGVFIGQGHSVARRRFARHFPRPSRLRGVTVPPKAMATTFDASRLWFFTEPATDAH